MNITSGKSFIIATAALCTAATAQANSLSHNTLWQAAPNSLTPSAAYLDDRFGHAVAIDGDWALVGAPRDDEQGLEAGAVYVYGWQNGQWQLVDKLLAADGQSGDSFGYSVSIAGQRAVIGTVFDDDLGTDAGAAYVFEFDGVKWQAASKLTADDGQALDFFGIAISQANDRILIGASHHDAAAASGGSAFIFEQHNGHWTQTARLNAHDTGAGDQFGHALSLSGDRALIGAHRNQIDGMASGAAYVFDLNGETWQETAKLTAPDGEDDDRFGIAVSLDGGQALIGANGRQQRQGGALLYQLHQQGWSHQSTLEASDGDSWDRFGSAVSLQGSVALVSAPHALAGSTGAVYRFSAHQQGWQPTQTYTPDNTGEVLFGQSIAQSASRIMIGASGLDAHPTGAGAVYVFTDQPRFSHHW